MNLDKWQEEVLATKGNLVLRSGRQVGKSTVIGEKAARFALENPNKLIMVIAKVERQAQLLFAKILFNIHTIDRWAIKTGRDKKTKELFTPTKHKITLKNGSVIHCLPAGDTGFGIMGYTIDLLIADEAAFIPEAVWTSITPALAVSRGNIWLLSTPFIKEGFYYRCFQDKNFTQFHTSGEDCPRKDQKFLDYQKSWMTKAEYAQMHLGEFVDEFNRFFLEQLILKCCVGKREIYSEFKKYYMGVDIARLGKDESTFEVLDGTNSKNVKQVENIITTKTLLTDTEDRIIDLDKKWNFKRKGIGIDDAGLGAGVYDTLRRTKLKRKIIGLNNARRSIDADDRKKKLLKEDMYNNLLSMMEKRQIILLDDDEVKSSLRSIQFDQEKQTISGSYSHIAEGLIRAAWCIKEKGLNIYYY